jgi:hypothetical protein
VTIAEVTTNLLGEIVEIYRNDNYSNSGLQLCARGCVRAVYVADNTLMVLVEHNLGQLSWASTDRTRDGGLAAYSMHQGRTRVVQRCGRCDAWDQKSMLTAVYPGEGLEKAWEHRVGEGCKKVGHDG